MPDYSSILKTVRLRPSDVSDRTIVTESESDRGRVLFCAAFRRLQQKAQVFSLEPNAAVRSRLTHSLEVSQLGRYIADEIGQRLQPDGLMSSEERAAFVNFVETACLMHDIGNPPFGHFGEAAIKKWFKDNGKECIKRAVALGEGDLGTGDPRLIAALADFLEFDGNPQGLRIVARLQWNTDEHGLNLTKTTLLSFLKYVRQAGERISGQFCKKAGYFQTEQSIVAALWKEFNFAAPQRFPLAYVMEAADDIAYCVSDLEDSVEKGLVHQPTAMAAIEQVFLSKGFGDDDSNAVVIREALQSIREGVRRDGKEFTYTDFRTSLNRVLVKYAADRYVTHHAEVLDGSLDALLPANSPCGSILEALKSYCKHHVYGHVSIQRTELAGYTAIGGLLDHFKPLLECSRGRFVDALNKAREDGNGSPIVIEAKLLSLFPERYIKVYRAYTKGIGADDAGKFTEWNARAHLIVDFISGMTDDFSMKTFRTLSGMRL